MFVQRGRVLIAQRPTGKALAGRWEFPGGKLLEGETDAAALQRELREELGVIVQSCEPLLTILHDYGDRIVELRMRIVGAYRGVPRGLEAQAIRWVAVDQLDAEDVLEADQPFIKALQSRDAAAR